MKGLKKVTQNHIVKEVRMVREKLSREYDINRKKLLNEAKVIGKKLGVIPSKLKPIVNNLEDIKRKKKSA
jgi:hypothetical protein